MNHGIAININNDPKILKLIVDSLPYLHNKWMVAENVKAILGDKNHVWFKGFPNGTPKYYSFNLHLKRFAYMMDDKDQNKEGLPINDVFTISKASELMDYVYEVDSTERYKDSSDGKWKICTASWL